MDAVLLFAFKSIVTALQKEHIIQKIYTQMQVITYVWVTHFCPFAVLARLVGLPLSK